MVKKPLIALLLSILIFNTYSQPQCELNHQNDQTLKDCLNNIKADSIKSYMQSLEDFGTRYFLDENRKEVTKWLSEKLKGFGYQHVNVDSFYYDEARYPASWQYNIVCKSSNFDESKPFIIIGAHYDAVDNCPGADDNGSGTAGVLELARTLRDYQDALNYPVKYILFAAEEVGLVGSRFDAFEARLKNDDIKLMINMDMISHSSSDSTSVYLSHVNKKVGFLSTILNDFALYTGLSPEDYNSPASDHASYLNSGYNIAYFHEKEFSPYYHKPEDIVSNTNPFYASGIVKSVVSAVFGFNYLVPVITNDYYWWGNGAKLTLSWITEEPVDEFEVFKKEGNIYEKIGTTYNTNYTFEDLKQDTSHNFVIVSNSQQNKYASSPIEVNYSMLPPKPEHVTAYGFETTIELKWESDNKGIIEGYNVYEFAGGEINKINTSLIADTIFTKTISDADFHYFQVTAVSNDGVESEKSELVSAKLGEHIYLKDSIEVLLLLDMSQYNFWVEELLQYFDFLNQDYKTYVEVLRGADVISEELLSSAKNIIWVSSGKILENSTFTKNSKKVYKYLGNGGNLFFSVYSANVFTALYNRDLPSVLPVQSDAYSFLKTQEVSFIENSRFSGAKAEKAGYPDLTIDINNIPENYLTLNYLDAIQSIKPTPDAELIYSYVSPVPNDINHGNMHGMPVGYEYIGGDFKIVFLSFPINFMKQDETQALVEHVINNRFGTGTEISEKIKVINKPQLNVWPVPANSQLNIDANGLAGIVGVYNSLGVKVLEQGFNGELFLNTSQWDSGTYFLTFTNNDVNITRKVLVIH